MTQRNKTLLTFTICLIVGIIVGATVLKVYNNHIDAEYEVLYGAVEYGAGRCFLEEVCTGDTVTIGELISYGYIEKVIDPVSKEYVSEDTIVTYIDGKVSVEL